MRNYGGIFGLCPQQIKEQTTYQYADPNAEVKYAQCLQTSVLSTERISCMEMSLDFPDT